MLNKRVKILIGAILGLIVAMVIGSLVYLSIYYKADETALALLEEEFVVELEEGVLYLEPELESETGIIFYPGAKVEFTAYLPMMNKLREEGVAVVLLEMPFNMAFFDVDAADKVYDLVPSVKEWYMVGHSLGGGMASAYAQDNEDKIKGLMVLGAYVYGDYPGEKALSIYGEYNSNLEESFRDGDNVVMIPGGNHAQFGNYGKQKGDTPATISAEEQQAQGVSFMLEFMGM